MKRQTAIYFLFIFAFFVFISIFRGWFTLYHWPLWIGGLVGMILPAIDHVIYVYLLRPYELTSQRVVSLVKQRSFKGAALLLYDTRNERTKMIFHTAYFQIIFLVLTFLVATSSGSWFGRGIVLAASVHILIDQLDDLTKRGSLDNWFRESSFLGAISLPKEKALAYWIIILLVTLFIGFFV